MKKIYIIVLLFLTLPLYAKMLISPIDSMKYSFGSASEISKQNILLNSTQASQIQKSAKVKLKSKIFRVFTAKKGEEILGYGILVNRKIRSKNGVVLYMISKDSVLKSIEMIAFNEPMEYLPSTKWLSQFDELTSDKKLRVGKEIATITGATLSARSVTDGSRLAFAFYDEIIKGK
ncbi:MAG: FMN-binding protein [Campylobacterota bacterium]|nr:FMN-binding protein [Campylobacterota bacterium]